MFTASWLSQRWTCPDPSALRQKTKAPKISSASVTNDIIVGENVQTVRLLGALLEGEGSP